jgi:ribosomal protein S3AE
MASKKSKSSEMKVRKKKWVEIISPEFNNQKIGETHVFEIEEAVGKPICINLMNLVGDPRKQNVDIQFKTTEQIGETSVKSEIQALVVQQPSLRKMVRRGKTKVQDSFKCYTVDNKPVVIKAFILTRKLVENSIATSLRDKIKRWAVNRMSKMTFADFVRSAIEGKFRKEIISDLNKIYPVKFVEFNTIKLLSSEKGLFEKPSDDKNISKRSKKSKSAELEEDLDDKEEVSEKKSLKKKKEETQKEVEENSEEEVNTNSEEEAPENSEKEDLEEVSENFGEEDSEKKSLEETEQKEEETKEDSKKKTENKEE